MAGKVVSPSFADFIKRNAGQQPGPTSGLSIIEKIFEDCLGLKPGVSKSFLIF